MPRPAPSVTAKDQALLDDYAKVIDEALDAFFAWTEATEWQPTSTSPQEYERQCLLRQYGPGGAWDGSDAQTALGLASMFVSLSGQYLEGVRALLQTRHVIVPLAPIVRSAFEAACRVAWLLEPLQPRRGRVAPLPIRDRAARVAAIRLEDLTRRKTVAISLGDKGAPRFGAQVRQLRRQLLPDLFYPSEIADENGELVIRDQRLPGFRAGAEAYEQTFGVSWKAAGAYDWLANASHPTPTMIHEITVAGPRGARRFQIEDASYPCRLTRLALVSFLHTWGQVAEYIELPHDDVAALLARVDSLGP